MDHKTCLKIRRKNSTTVYNLNVLTPGYRKSPPGYDKTFGVGVVLVMCSLFELVIAQTPNRMRGIMMGVVIVMLGFGTLGNTMFAKIFQQLQAASPSCVFYYYLVLSLLLLLILIVFVILAKRYKLREREKHINIQAIVEEHYERYFDQEEEYMREAAHRY